MKNLNNEKLERLYVKALERNINYLVQDTVGEVLSKNTKFNNTRGNVHGRMNGVITKKRHDSMLKETYNQVFA